LKILVTGHLGYVGAVLTPRLLAAGHEVHGLDSDLYRDCAILKTNELVPRRQIDLRDIEAQHLEGYDVVVHLAALSNDPLGAIDPLLTHIINGAATVRLAELARRGGVGRLVFTSTCGVYGKGGDETLVEASSTDPQTAYAESKLDAEIALTRLTRPDFDVIILRPESVYGWSPRLRFDLLVNNLVAWAVATGRVPLKSDGISWRSLIHVVDLATTIQHLAELPACDRTHHVFNVGRPGDAHQIRAIAALVAERIPDAKVATDPDAEPDTRNYRVDPSRLIDAHPGLEFAWTAQRGIDELRSALAAKCPHPEDFEGARYSRVEYLKRLRVDGALDDTLRWRHDLQTSSRGDGGRGACDPADLY